MKINKKTFGLNRTVLTYYNHTNYDEKATIIQIITEMWMNNTRYYLKFAE